MIGVGVARGRLAAAGDALGEGVGVAGLVFELVWTAGDVADGVAAAGGASKLITPLFQICSRLEAFISTSIGTRFGFAGCDGSVICFPLTKSWALDASDFA